MSAAMVSVQLKNFPQLEQAFKKLPAEIKEKALRAVFRAGASKIAAAARAAAPVRKGRIRGSIATRWAKEGRWTVSRDAYAKTGSKRADRAGAYYAHMVEFGHWATGRSRKRGKGATWQGPQPFMRPAFDQNVAKIVANFETKTMAKAEQLLSKVK